MTWFSLLQTAISLSMTEAEYIALSREEREVLPLRELILEIKPILEISEAKLQDAQSLKITKVPRN